MSKYLCMAKKSTRWQDTPQGKFKLHKIEYLAQRFGGDVKNPEIRKKWESFQKDGKNYNVFNEEQAMMEEVEDFIAQGQKINAIKVYRNKMKEIYGTKLGLRECKDYIDSLQVDLNKRGVIK